MTETTTTDRPLPYGMTVAEVRQMIAKHAQYGEAAFLRILNDVPPGQQPKVTGALEGDELEHTLLGHYASHYGWSVVALLRWLGEEYGPEAAWRAAAIVQDLGENGGNHLVEDIPMRPTNDAAEVQR